MARDVIYAHVERLVEELKQGTGQGGAQNTPH
jgi:hypothetical protein